MLHDKLLKPIEYCVRVNKIYDIKVNLYFDLFVDIIKLSHKI